MLVNRHLAELFGKQRLKLVRMINCGANETENPNDTARSDSGVLKNRLLEIYPRHALGFDKSPIRLGEIL